MKTEGSVKLHKIEGRKREHRAAKGIIDRNRTECERKNDIGRKKSLGERKKLDASQAWSHRMVENSELEKSQIRNR